MSVPNESPYFDKARIEENATVGNHRDIVGGLWDQIGRHQFDFLKSVGLQPDHLLLDIGCGSFRGGVHFARYLNSGNYFGHDLNRSLIEVGYAKELTPLGLDAKVPEENLISSDGFDFSGFAQKFDIALALSVFTHLSLNSIRTCLEQLSVVMQPSGRFFASIFEAPLDTPAHHALMHETGGIVTFGDRDPYHYRPEDIAYIAKSAGWVSRWIGDFAHPRNQKMVEFTLEIKSWGR